MERQICRIYFIILKVFINNYRVKEDLTLFVLLFAEIEGLRDRVLQKDKELEELKQTYIKSVYK